MTKDDTTALLACSVAAPTISSKTCIHLMTRPRQICLYIWNPVLDSFKLPIICYSLQKLHKCIWEPAKHKQFAVVCREVWQIYKSGQSPGLNRWVDGNHSQLKGSILPLLPGSHVSRKIHQFYTSPEYSCNFKWGVKANENSSYTNSMRMLVWKYLHTSKKGLSSV